MPTEPAHERMLRCAIGPAAMAWLGGALAALLIALAFTAAFNHDESQYVAAVAMMPHGLPFRDFAYLQTPLQPLLFAPLAWLPPGWLLFAHRIVNALCMAAAAVIVARAVARHGGSRAAALVAGLGFALADVSIFAATVARNDALPALLFAAGLAIALEFMNCARGTPARAATATMLMAAAVAAKVSYGPPAAAAMLMLLMRGHLPWRLWWATILGGLAGLMPCLLLIAIDPAGFRFGVIDYSLYAPQQWRMLNGDGEMLAAGAKLLRLLKYAAAGAMLPALLVVLVDRLRRRGGRDDRLALLDAVTIAALASAYLPDPSFRQYLVPLAPALFLRLGLTLGHLRPRWRRWTIAMLTLFALAGLVRSGKQAVQAVRKGAPMAIAIADARWLAPRVVGRSVATWAPDRIAGAGVTIDPRFVAGPFLFRIEGRLADLAEAAIPSLSAHETDAKFAAQAPGAIVTGAERRPFPRHRQGLDGTLDAWAARHGYRDAGVSPGGLRLWLALERHKPSE